MRWVRQTDVPSSLVENPHPGSSFQLSRLFPFFFFFFPLLSLPLFLSEVALIIAFILLSARVGLGRNTQCFSHLPVIFSPRNGPLHSQELMTLLPGCLLA